MKSIMTKLRVIFSLNRVELEKYLSMYGFKNKNEDLTFDRYCDFLRAACPTITRTEAIYIFKRTDTDNSGTISID
jgi:Ca2+-binding EF-hand superfamily protein